MLQTLRDKTTGWVAVLVVGALAIPFAFVGIENYANPSSADYVAKVGDIEIGRADFQRRLENYVQQSQQMMGESFQRSLVDTPEARRQLLDRMIDEALYRNAARELAMVVPPARLRQEIQGIPSLQVAGQFSPELYRQLLQSQGLTATGLEQLLMRDIEASLLPQGIASSAFVSAGYVDSFLKLRDQKRSFSYVELVEPELATVPSDVDLKAYFDENVERYRSEEQVSIEYVEIAPGQIPVSEDVSDETLRERYAGAGRRFVEAEQRLTSHILVRVPANSDADVERAALEKAEAIALQVDSQGAVFQDIARERSEDPGSKGSGGDLGWLERGFTDAAFEDALFAMESGSISAPVKSAEGWHIIQLREVRDEVAKPFESVRDELRTEYLSSERDRLSDESAGRLVDLLLKDPTSLAQTAQDLGLELKTAGPFSRSGGSDPVTQDRKIQDAAFSTGVLDDRLVSDTIELADSRRVALRLTEHLPSQLREFEDVRVQVMAELSETRRAELARTQAEAALAQLTSGSSTLESIAEAGGAELKTADAVGRNAFTVDPALLREAFKLSMPSGQTVPVRAMVELGGARFGLIDLASVQEGDPSTVPQAERDALRTQIATAVGEAEAQALAEALRQRTEIELAEDTL
jgi:peptidyl-prolyl cis-trans isomerase D